MMADGSGTLEMVSLSIAPLKYATLPGINTEIEMPTVYRNGRRGAGLRNIVDIERGHTIEPLNGQFRPDVGRNRLASPIRSANPGHIRVPRNPVPALNTNPKRSNLIAGHKTLGGDACVEDRRLGP